MQRDELLTFSPLPPARNGIADYAFQLLEALASRYECLAVTEDPHASIPNGVRLVDSAQAFRFARGRCRRLYQIGNNPGHVFVLDALRTWGGVTTLHDQSLHYLYEVSGAPVAQLAGLMTMSSSRMGSIYSRHWLQFGLKTRANYALFDMLSEVLELSSAVIVHSLFAKRRIELLYGESRARNVYVVPHLSFPLGARDADSAAIRSKFAVPHDVPLIVTSGFATYAKRFDWLVAALGDLVRTGAIFHWVHAGSERPDEFDLSNLITQDKPLAAISKITGYISESDLDAMIDACDIFVNLRFPSVGESSGSLARAMSFGKCCIVSDTAAYAELPRNVVVHVPIVKAAECLLGAIQKLLTDRELRESYGAAAKRLADSKWRPSEIATQYMQVLEAFPPHNARTSQRSKEGNESLRKVVVEPEMGTEQLKALLWLEHGIQTVELVFASAQHLAWFSYALRGPVTSLLPSTFSARTIECEKSGGGLILRISGHNA